MKKFFLFAIFFSSTTLVHLHAWTPVDTLKIKEIGKIAIAPTEKQVAYEVLTPFVDAEKGVWQKEIYVAGRASTSHNVKIEKIPLKEYVSNSLEWFPDGKSLLFISKVDSRAQVCRFFLATGKVETVLDTSSNITNIQVSHKGDKIAFLELQKPKQNPIFEVVDEFSPKCNLCVLHIDSGKVDTIVDEDFSIGSFNWSPDDEYIIFDHQPTAKIEDRVLYSKISKVQLSPRLITSLVNNNFSNFNPQYSPDGKKIAYVSAPGTWEFAFHLHVIDNYTGRDDQLVITPDEQVELVGWLSDSTSLLVAERYHTAQHLYTVSINTAECRRITPQDSLVLQPKISSKGNLIAFRSESPNKPCEVYISESVFIPKQISHIQTADAYPQLNTKIISWKAEDGEVIEGLLTLPTKDCKEPYPLLVLIRGHSSLYLNTYEGGIHLAKTPYSIGVFAHEGYAVLRPFFRGTSGYGRLMRNSILGDWGGKDFDDLMEGISFLAQKGIIDPKRMGIMGWSYGGFMTANAITKTTIFKAASAGGALVDFISYAGTTDIPHFLPYYMNGCFWSNRKNWKRCSPIEHVARVKTPTLIQHSSGDRRVPVAQAHELYNALKYQQVPTKLILYTDSGHSLSNPKAIVEGIQHNVDWFNFWVKGEAEAVK